MEGEQKKENETTRESAPRKLTRINPRTSAEYKGGLTYRLFCDDVFYQCLLALSSQSWGGKADASIQRIVRSVLACRRDFHGIRGRYIKTLGKPAGGDYSMDGASASDTQEFDEAMEELYTAEIETPQGIDLPFELVKHKKNNLAPVQAAILQDIFRIKWNESDEGQDLDKEK
jgi:hypothetical protein